MAEQSGDIFDEYYDNFEPDVDPNEDPYVLQAKKEILSLFDANKTAVYYISQLEVILEDKYFHWITANALKELRSEGKLRTERRNTSNGNRVFFIVHPTNRYYKREINKRLSILERYFEEKFERGCGKQAELLFIAAFAGRGFIILGEDLEYRLGEKLKKAL